MSLYPVFKRIVTGASGNTSDFDFYNKRCKRGTSADSTYVRGCGSVPNSWANQSRTTARELTEEPMYVPALKPFELGDWRVDKNSGEQQLKSYNLRDWRRFPSNDSPIPSNPVTDEPILWSGERYSSIKNELMNTEPTWREPRVSDEPWGNWRREYPYNKQYRYTHTSRVRHL